MARAEATNLAQTQIIISTNFPIAQASAVVNGASASAIANAATHSVTGESTASIGGCTCTAGSSALTILTGMLVLSGAVGDVDVNITALRTLLREVQTDEFGRHAESETLFDVLLNGTPIFSLQVDAMNPSGQMVSHEWNSQTKFRAQSDSRAAPQTRSPSDSPQAHW